MIVPSEDPDTARLPSAVSATARTVSAYLQERLGTGEIVTGLLYVDESSGDFHDLSQTSDTPLASLPYEKLCPGAAALEKLQEEFR